MKHTENENKPKIIIIAGPTGVGKTRIAIQMAQKWGGEIIGADAIQVYRYMDIGTAKPDFHEQAQVKHHMIDVIDPDVQFDAAMYVEMARHVIQNLHEAGKPIFLVGGSGLYIKALTGGLFAQAPGNPSIRQKFKQMASERGNAFLYEMLQKQDTHAASTIHPNDMVRIIRALEVFEITGRSIKDHHQAHQFADQPYQLFQIMLNEDRKLLYNRIEHRVDQMIQDGLLKEVQSLIQRGYHCQLSAMQSIGYKHMCAFLNGQLDWRETIRLMKRDSRRYAKRQFTWFRANKSFIWTLPAAVTSLYPQVHDFIYSNRNPNSANQPCMV
jgi:tRNA dimethylallyltransferase